MMHEEIQNVANVARQLAVRYYGDSTHDETIRAADFLRAYYNENEAEMNGVMPLDHYDFAAFLKEYRSF